MKIITPKDVVTLDPEFAENYHDSVIGGMRIAKRSNVVVVGLARQIAQVVPLTLQRLSILSKFFDQFSVVVVENDSTDGTPDLFKEWSPGFNVIVESEKLDRPHLPTQRDSERTIPLAEYRQRCLEIAEGLDPDYVIVMDYDAWGGFLNEGIMSSLHYLHQGPWIGLGSVGLAQIPQLRNEDGSYSWFHYDAWAYRPTWSWRQRPEMWIHHLTPPFGCPPIEVNSCFGGCAVYHACDALRGRYSGTLFGAGDCEHVAFHRSLLAGLDDDAKIGINPSSVGVMFWQTEESEASEAA